MSYYCGRCKRWHRHGDVYKRHKVFSRNPPSSKRKKQTIRKTKRKTQPKPLILIKPVKKTTRPKSKPKIVEAKRIKRKQSIVQPVKPVVKNTLKKTTYIVEYKVEGQHGRYVPLRTGKRYSLPFMYDTKNEAESKATQFRKEGIGHTKWKTRVKKIEYKDMDSFTRMFW